MKRNFPPIALGAGLMLAVLAGREVSSFGDGPSHREPCPVAVIDFAHVFKNCASFAAEIAALKAEVATVESQLKAKREAISQREEELEKLSDAAEIQERREQLTRDKREFNRETTNLRKELLDRECKIYHAAYVRVQSTVRQYAQDHGLRLVVRHNDVEVPPDVSREDLLKAINRPIIYHEQIDITAEILALLNEEEASGEE